MAEETQNPSRNVPNAMVAAMVGTYVLGYIVGFAGVDVTSQLIV
jgi:amino acid transporter